MREPASYPALRIRRAPGGGPPLKARVLSRLTDQPQTIPQLVVSLYPGSAARPHFHPHYDPIDRALRQLMELGLAAQVGGGRNQPAGKKAVGWVLARQEVAHVA